MTKEHTNTDQCPGASVCCNPSWCKTTGKRLGAEWLAKQIDKAKEPPCE